MSSIKHCGFCSLLSGLMRRAMCISSRRGSSESYYRELGDQDTLKIDGSQGSEDSVEIHIAFPRNGSDHETHNEAQRVQRALRAQQARQVEDSTDARGRASTSTARPYQRPSTPEAQGPVEPASVVPAAAQVTAAVAAAVPAPEAATIAVLETAPATLDDVTATPEPRRSRAMTRIRPTGRFLSMHKRRRRRLLTHSLVEGEALLDDLLIGQVQCILDQSAAWRFNAFTLDNVAGGRGLPVLCVHLFQVYGLISHFRLDPAKVWKLFSLFEENYHSNNPYHNSIHAADVTQAMHCFLQQDQILEHMQPIEVMAGLLAAMAHDLDHPGVNQPFLVATCNHLVALYQSKSVLENHHWRSAISCLIESQILDDMPQYQHQLEDKIRALILATDITRQQDYLGQFKVYLDTNTLDLTRPEHRLLVLQIALKCADISNPCRPWDISHTWSMKVCEEFFRQGDVERRLNLPLSPLCDRNTTTVPKIQTGFFKYVVTPLITEWHRFLQSDLSEQMLKNLVTNHKKWDSFDKEEQAISEAQTQNSDADIVDDDMDSGNLSDSSEMLLPRRGSLIPVPLRPAGFREQLRRFSVPLNVFQDSRRRMDEAAAVTHLDGSPVGSDRSLGEESPERVLSSDKLIPESSIASITTPLQAQRINQVLRNERKWTLVRQTTFPPLEAMTRAHSLIPRASSHDDCIYPRAVKSDSGIRFDVTPDARQDSSRAGARLRENLTAWHRDFSRRRKSMPAETLNGRERQFRELREVLPQLIARSLSTRDRREGREAREGRGRRGSAPAPGTLLAPARAPRLCQLTARTEPLSPQPRRSSLPVEVMTGVSSY